MSSEKQSPPTIVPKVVPPRPDEVTGTATRPPASNGTARPAGGGTTEAAQPGKSSAPVPPPPPSVPAGGTSSGGANVPVADTPVPPPPTSGGSTARSGALKAAAAAMATAKAAAKKLAEPSPPAAKVPAPPAPAPVSAPAPAPANASQHSPSELDDRTVPRVTKSSTTAASSTGGSQEVPAMHYTAAGLSGSASPVTGSVPSTGQPAATANQPRPATGTTPAAKPNDGPRRVRLAISRVDPWSVMKLSFLLAVAIGIMTVVATAVLWTVLDGMGVFTEINSLVRSIVGEASPINVLEIVEFNKVVALSTLIAIVNMVLITALSTIMAFIYNIVAALVGGVHLTLTDD